MEATSRQGFSRKILALILALTVGAILLLPLGGAAYAAESADAQDNAGIQNPLAAQYYYMYSSSPTSAVPDNNPAYYEVYPTYLFFSIGTDPNLINYNMYMDYRPVGGAWSTVYFNAYMQSYTVSGLAPNTTYEARLYYGYGSNPVKRTGPYSASIFFRTGPNKKPAVKSVKTQIIKFKKHRKKFTNVYLGWYYSYATRGHYDIFTYRIRTTVKFKKAPRTPFVVINGKWYKGKKKKYTFTTKKLVRYYTTPKKHTTYTTTVYTAQNKAWKGYSLYYQKTKKRIK